MINDLDDTLADLLKASLPEAWRDVVAITFAAPDNQFPPQGLAMPAIDFFLYDVRENLELRSNEISLQRRADGTALRRLAPVRIDFSYLVTAWPSEGVADPWKDEHRLLGVAMQALLRYRTIPHGALRGELANQELPLPVSSLRPGRLQSLGEFWQAMGGRPKAALEYTVTLAVSPEASEVPLVLETFATVGPLAAAPRDDE
jgi:hypothetical protein